ncbi:MAG: hypothetical protein ABL982_00075 [Vicinamibacterales bacterium]
MFDAINGTITPRGSSNPVPGGLEERYREEVDWGNPSEPAPGRRDSADLGAAAIVDRDWQSWEAYLKSEAAKAGVAYDPSDLADVVRNVTYARNSGKDPAQFLAAGVTKYAERASNKTAGSGDDGGSNGTGKSPFNNATPTFDDPAQRLLEDYALDRFNHLQNPEDNSGTALYEQYLKDYVQKLSEPVYNPQEEAALKAKAYNSIYEERDKAREQFLQHLSSVRLSPTSGPAIAGLKEIDAQFEKVRAQADNDFATQAIQLRRENDANAMNVLGSLAGNEEQRLTNAGTYATIPYSLEQDAFSRNMQLAGLGGSPESLVSSVMAIAQQVSNNNNLSAAERQASISSIMEWLAGLAE